MKFKYFYYFTIFLYLISSGTSYSIEQPDIKNLIIHKEKKINIIPINIGEEEYEKSKIFFDELGIDNLEIFSGPSGELAKKFKLRGVPTTIILDKEGHEISRIL